MMSKTYASRWRMVIREASNRATASLVIFLGGLVLLGGLGFLRANDQILNSDLFSLVAPIGDDPLRSRAIDRIRTLSERRQTWMIAHPDQEAAYRAAIRLKEQLLDGTEYEDVGGSIAAGEILAFYNRFPFLLADDESLALPPSTAADDLVDRVERALYSSGMALPGLNLANDPFLLQARFLAQLAHTPPPFTVDRGLLAGRLEGQWVYLLPVTLNGNAFDFEFQRAIQKLVRQVVPAIEAETAASIKSVGTIDFAAANRELALEEVSMIGGASLLLIVVLMASTFRHPRPFLAVGFTIATGIVAGIAVCLICFRSIHLLTLVGGSTLIGITVDYAFHLLADGYQSTDRPWQVAGGLLSVLPAITLGLATSLLGFVGLYASGFEGLKQIAVFSAAGLCTAYVGLILCYPLLLGGWRASNRRPLIFRLASRWTRLWRPRRQVLIALAVCAGGLAWFGPGLNANSDVRLLAARSPEIDALTARAAFLSAAVLDSRFMVVHATSLEDLLQQEEVLREHLIELRNSGAISHFNQLSQFVPSMRRQQQALALNQRLYLAPGAAVDELGKRLGLSSQAIGALRDTLQQPPPAPLTLSEWLQSPLADPVGHLYIGDIGDQVASIVTLAGVADVARLREVTIGLTGVTLVDNVADITELFQLYVDNAVRGLGIAFVLVAVLMCLRFGLLDGALTMLVPLIAFAATLWTLQLIGEPINLFHIVGLTLVLGTGMDYTLFLKSAAARPHAMLAVLMAALTTECAFGLLGLSQVRAIHSFGLAVALGTAVTFLLAPMAAGHIPEKDR